MRRDFAGAALLLLFVSLGCGLEGKTSRLQSAREAAEKHLDAPRGSLVEKGKEADALLSPFFLTDEKAEGFGTFSPLLVEDGVPTDYEKIELVRLYLSSLLATMGVSFYEFSLQTVVQNKEPDSAIEAYAPLKSLRTDQARNKFKRQFALLNKAALANLGLALCITFKADMDEKSCCHQSNLAQSCQDSEFLAFNRTAAQRKNRPVLTAIGAMTCVGDLTWKSELDLPPLVLDQKKGLDLLDSMLTWALLLLDGYCLETVFTSFDTKAIQQAKKLLAESARQAGDASADATLPSDQSKP